MIFKVDKDGDTVIGTDGVNFNICALSDDEFLINIRAYKYKQLTNTKD